MWRWPRNGGGIGTYWGKVRSIGEKVKTGQTCGIIPFIHVMDGLTLAIQPRLAAPRLGGGLSRHHPSGDRGVPGNPQGLRRFQPQGPQPASRHQHHRRIHGSGARRRDVRPKSPKTGEVLREVNARQLWQRILETRLQTGEPYILNIDAVNRALPKHQRELGLKVNTSNLCSEITLPTGIDHRGKDRTAVCCLSSLNIETWDQWARRAGLRRRRAAHARQCADQTSSRPRPTAWSGPSIPPLRERSVGLGVMGFHSFLQSKGIPMESAMAKSWNLRIFKKITPRS